MENLTNKCVSEKNVWTVYSNSQDFTLQTKESVSNNAGKQMQTTQFG